MRTCSKCGTSKPLTDYRKRGSGYAYMCRQCDNKRLLSSYHKNKSTLLYPKRSKEQITIDILEKRKTCNYCGNRKDFEDFYSHSSTPDRIDAYCKSCNIDKSKDRHLRSKYDISLTEYNTMLEKQGGTCKVCNSDTRLVVDHCHTHGHIRGILCHQCNVAIGCIKDNPTIAIAIAEYLSSLTLDS